MNAAFMGLLAAVLFTKVVIALFSARPKKQSKHPRPTDYRLFLIIVLLLLAGGLARLEEGPFRLNDVRSMATAVPLAMFIGMFVVWPLARHVFAPLGMVRTAYYVGYASWASPEDRIGRALMAGAIALHRKSQFDAESASFLEERITSQKGLRGGGIVAAAASAAARGDREGARALFLSIGQLDPRATTREAIHIAYEWLAADAAGRGAWQEVIDLGISSSHVGRSAWLLIQVAKRLLCKPDAPTRNALLLHWLFAPRRRHTFAIVERALSIEDNASMIEDEEENLPTVSDSEGPLAKALALHVALLSMKKPTAVDIVYTARSFDIAFEGDALLSLLQKRAEVIGASRPDDALRRFRDDVEDSLFHLLKAHSIALDDTKMDLGEFASAAQRRLRDETLAVIEALSDAVGNRAREKRALSAIDEWREFAALKMAYERGMRLGGPELRYLAFTKVHTDLSALAVWLFNERGERPIANAMLRFLLSEAQAVGDAEAIELQTKNVAIGV
ncbi:MAG: hypothetical protein IPK82_04210 [Polyangiaceae bacterium]|nr:hypothetical protein [Polyangiaceae bacterium]